MDDTPIETPLETARRVWPADWDEIGPPNTLSLRAGTRGAARISVGVYSVRPGDWVASVDDRDVARGPDLAAVLAEARDKVQAAVAELARAVGLEVSDA